MDWQKMKGYKVKILHWQMGNLNTKMESWIKSPKKMLETKQKKCKKWEIPFLNYDETWKSWGENL
jgi:hypothetical protein